MYKLSQTPLSSSIWASAAISAPETQTLTHEISVDVLVVGAGVTGLSAAYHVKKSGASVAVLEAGDIGEGGSGRNNGMLIPTLSKLDPEDILLKFGADSGEKLVRLIGGSANQAFDFIRQHNLDCDAVQNGWMAPAHRSSRMDMLKSRHDQWAKFGLDSQMLDRNAANKMLGSEWYHGGIFFPDGGHVNPLGFTREFARVCLEQGVEIYTQSPATRVLKSEGKWVVKTPTGRVSADQVILATNAYTDRLWPKLKASIVPLLNFQMATQPQSAEIRAKVLPTNIASSDTQADLHFYHWDRDGRMIAGATLALPWIAPMARLRDKVGHRVAKVFPTMGKPWFTHIWSGFLAMVPDFAPHFHHLDTGVYGAVGYCGRGFALGFSAGAELAKAVAGVPEQDLSIPFSDMKPAVPLHDLTSPFASLAMLHYRRFDSKD